MTRRTSMAADLIAVLAATLSAVELRLLVGPLLGLQPASLYPEWPLAIPFVAVLGAFYSAGLYERDAYVSRPLHAWTVVRSCVLAFVLSAAGAFLVGPGWFNISRLTLVLTFALLPPIDLLLRLVVLHSGYVEWVKRRRPVGFVVGRLDRLSKDREAPHETPRLRAGPHHQPAASGSGGRRRGSGGAQQRGRRRQVG